MLSGESYIAQHGYYTTTAIALCGTSLACRRTARQGHYHPFFSFQILAVTERQFWSSVSWCHSDHQTSFPSSLPPTHKAVSRSKHQRRKGGRRADVVWVKQRGLRLGGLRKWVWLSARSESGQGAVVAAVKRIVEFVQSVELCCQLHTLPALSLNAAPVPFAISRRQVHVAQINRLVAQVILATLPSTRSGRQQTGVREHDGGVNSKAADLENVLAHGCGMDLLLPSAGGVLVVSGPDAAEAGIEPFGRPCSAFGHKVGDNVHPLAIPGSDPTPELVGLVGGYLPLKAAHDGAQCNGKVALDRLTGARVTNEPCLLVVGHVSNGGPQQVGAEVCS